jgi:glycosyltransferase involved in cell wall biosynthesis
MPADGHWRIAFAGRLVEPKGASLLIRALASLGANSELTVMGDGDEMASLVSLASGLGVAVTFAGRLERRAVLCELERSHVLVVPSLEEDYGEGIPTVIGEALWAGIPVIATSVGGVGRLFDDVAPGWLVAPGDEAALARALSEAMGAAHALAAQAAPTAYERILCPRAVLDRYEEAYELAKRAARYQRTVRRTAWLRRNVI